MKKLYTLILVCFCAIMQAQTITVSGEITTNTTWTKNNTYLLQGFVYVEDGATLTIEPGTTIKGDKASKGALIVTRSGKITAEGTADQPIVFTSNESNPTYGDWGGIIILGKAPTNAVTNGVPGEGIIEGGVENANGDGRYGGTDANDNSGVLSYVRIEYPGIAFQPNNEINGLTMGGVGRGTKIDHVQVSYSGDDAFEWFGGTVDAKYLIAYRALDDDFDTDFGYQGNIQYALSVRDPLVADVSGSNGFEIDNDATGSGNTPKTKPTFSNVTIVGPGSTPAADYRRAAHLRRNSEPGIFNTVLIGAYPVGVLIDGDSTIAKAQNGQLEIKNTYVAGQTELLKTTNAAFNVVSWFNTSAFNNKTYPNSSDLNLQNPFNLADPNASPRFNSPALHGGAFTSPRLSGSFFDKVTYAGAFNGTSDWTCPWSVYAAGPNTDCNVGTYNIKEFASEIIVRPTLVNNIVTIDMTIEKTSDVNIRLMDLNGSSVKLLMSDIVSPGKYSNEFSTDQLENGFYFIQFEIGSGVKTEKIIIIR
ncbi:MAG: T9SS type A sorting domain-containing protein [Bacteroidota bacterium]|nr:T9SS type A sorting domain-containing protein [Bacteroidota bacterium]